MLGSVLEKNQENIGTQEFISLEEAKSIALKDAGLDDKAQKIEFTKEELNRNQGTPCYILEFNNGEYHYTCLPQIRHLKIAERTDGRKSR